jgi:hypothetical protein
MLIAGVIALCGLGLVFADEDTLCIPMGDIVIEAPEDIESKRTPVEFPHSTHFRYTCQTCHHAWDSESPILSCMASGCHDLTSLSKNAETGKPDEASAVRYFKTAYHGTCIGCHKNIKKQNSEIEKSYATIKTPLQASGPTGCTECHPREE